MKRNTIVKLAVVLAIAAFTAATAYAGPLPKPFSKVPEAQKLIDQAWTLDRSQISAEVYKQCVALLEQADKLDPNNITILTDISRQYWNWGDNLPKETSEQQKFNVSLYHKGMEAAEKSFKVKETAPAHYWFAVNKAASMEFSSMPAQAAAFPVIYKHSQYVSKNDPEYYYGAVGRLWSEVLSRVPKQVVKMVGWDVQEAVNDIDKAIKTEPRYLENYMYKARFLLVYFENKEETLKTLDQMLKIDPNALPEEVTSNKSSQANGKILWKKITGKDYPQK